MQQSDWHIRNRIGLVTLLVHSYDDAIAFYRDTLDFTLREDSHRDDVKRWVVVSPQTHQGFGLLLAKASNEAQRVQVGNQSGGRVFLFLYTNDFWRDYNTLRERDVRFVRNPKQYDYGTVAVFADLYGNLWDLIEPQT